MDLNLNATVTGMVGPAERPAFVKIGHSGSPGQHQLPAGAVPLGYFSKPNLRNPLYGGRNFSVGADGVPGSVGDDDQNGTAEDASELGWPGSDDIINRCFDTWHPAAAVGSGDPINAFPNQIYFRELPPLAPTRVDVGTRTPWPFNTAVTYGVRVFPRVEDKNANGAIDLSEDNLPSSPPIWQNNGYLDKEIDYNNNGTLDPEEDLNGNNAWDTEDVNGNGVLDGYEDRNNNGTVNQPSDMDTSYYFTPIWVAEDLNGNQIPEAADGDDADGNGILTGVTGLREPDWPREPGKTVRDGGVIWQCFDNRVGLQMIRITIRYRDIGSGLPRQVTLIHSFVE
jgi:hypothetical protein